MLFRGGFWIRFPGLAAMARDERDYVRGPSRASQLAKRVLPEGEAAFRAGFAKGKLPVQDSFCVLCDAGVKRIKLPRQHVHYIKRRAVVCRRG
jgi:hypothetical protein